LSMEPWSALLEDQLRVMFWPAIIEAGVTVNDAVGGGTVPPPPLALPQLANTILKPKRSAHDVARALNVRRAKPLTIVKDPIPFHILLFPRGPFETSGKTHNLFMFTGLNANRVALFRTIYQFSRLEGRASWLFAIEQC